MRILLLIVVCTLFSNFADAKLAIIVHPSNTVTMDKDTIAALYLGKISNFPDGKKSVPISLAEGTAVQQYFVANVLERNPSQLKAYWAKLIFTGQGKPPKEVASDSEVIELVSNNPNIIGFVDESSITSTVRTVLTL